VRISVFKDSPAWGTVDRWFKLPIVVDRNGHTVDLLRELHVADYEVPEDEDGEPVIPMAEAASAVLAKHPGCVLVY
jgi:hypothetical protein